MQDEVLWEVGAGARLLCLLALTAAGCDDGWSPLARDAAAARELDFLRGVDVRTLSREEFTELAERQAAEIDETYLRYYASTYGRLGFFDPERSLRSAIARSSSEWVGASYSPGGDRITLVGDAPADTLVHEYVHALQDQNFDLVGYDAYETSDAFLARRAVVEGDATLAQYRFIRMGEYGDDLDAVNWPEVFARWIDYSERTLAESEYPIVLLDYVSFVYPYGLPYTAGNLLDLFDSDAMEPSPAPHDWGREDRLFTSVKPATTLAILAYDTTPSTPAPEIGIRGYEAPPAGLEMADWDVLGSWYVYLLLFPMQDQLERPLHEIIRSWRADTASFFLRDDGEYATVWTSQWDREQSAQEIARYLAILYGCDVLQGQGMWQRCARDELVWIQRIDDVVVATVNLPQEAAATVVSKAFESTSTGRPRMTLSLAGLLEFSRGGGEWMLGLEVPGNTAN